MGRFCAYCGASGRHAGIGEDGLCLQCHESILADVTDHVLVYNECRDTLNSSEELSVCLPAFSRAIEAVAYLRDTYEEAGIGVIEPSAQAKIDELETGREELVAESAARTLALARQAAGAATTPEMRALIYSLGLVAISRTWSEIRDPDKLAVYVDELTDRLRPHIEILSQSDGLSEGLAGLVRALL